MDTEAFSNEEFVRGVGQTLNPGAVVLDIGAGDCPYEAFFASSRYFSTDWADARDVAGRSKHEFLSSVDHLPVRSEWADAVTAFQVLDHTAEPEDVLKEAWRVLRPGGAIYLTVPQGWGLNMEPHHYYGFTRYGLMYLLRKAGFENIKIDERGGIFWLLSKRIRATPYYVMFQYVYPLLRPDIRVRGLSTSKLKNLLAVLFLMPFYLLTLPFSSVILPLILFYVDRLDRRKLYTLGYQCIGTKPTSESD